MNKTTENRLGGELRSHQAARRLLEELRQVALEAINSVDARYSTDWSAIKGAVKGDLSNYLYKKTKRSPMILPVIMEV